MRRFFTIILAGLILLPFLTLADYSQGTAASYLSSHTDNPWSTMALSALGTDSGTIDYLKNINSDTAIGLTAPMLAIASFGENPASFGDKDYVAELKKFYSAGQLGDSSTLNDDIFGLLALVSAGDLADPIAINIQNYLLKNQKSNGGWGFAVDGSTDSNMTAAAITALVASGISASDTKIQNAFNYLKTAQNDDGGFTYDPLSEWGRASDSSSTAWVMWALNASGIDQATWVKNGNTPAQYLESNQDSVGFFRHQTGSAEDAFSANTTAYAVIALSGKTLPLKVATTSPTFNFRIEGKSNTVCSGKVAGPTALDIVKNASFLCGFSYHIQSTSFGSYLDQIGDDKAEGQIGWLYLVNSISPSIGAADYILKANDLILWFYGDYNWKPTRLSLDQIAVNTGGTVIAKLEYFDDNTWSVFSEAKVYIGAQIATTDASGRASISMPDGYYKIFAENDGFIRSNGELLKVGNPSDNKTELKVVVEKGKVEGTIISFLVDQSRLDFGNLKPGLSATKTLSIKNTGDTDLAVEGLVVGDALFVENLSLDSVSWRNFKKAVNVEKSESINLDLSIPADYTNVGTKTATITFWVSAN